MLDVLRNLSFQMEFSDKVEMLVSMGFPLDDCRKYVVTCRGDLENTIEMLIMSTKRQPADVAIRYSHLFIIDISQYSFSDIGSSSCTSIACHAGLKLLSKLDKAVLDYSNNEFLVDIIITGVERYNILRNGGVVSDHFSVDEFLSNSPDLRDSFVTIPKGPVQGQLTTENAFLHLFQSASIEVRLQTKYIGIIITKPPETVLVILPPNRSQCQLPNQYFLFDSHPRPQLGITGAYLQQFDNPEALQYQLLQLFPPFPDSFPRRDESFMVSMFNSFEGTIVQLKPDDVHVTV